MEPTGTLVQLHTSKAEPVSTEEPLLTFDLLKSTLVDVSDQIVISEGSAVPAGDVLASIAPATVMLALLECKHSYLH